MSGAVGELLERCRAAGLLLTAEDEALHVPFEREPPGELIEELRQRKPEIMAALASATATTPPQLFESEPFYHEPCPTRRGLIRHSEGRFRAFLRRLRQLGCIRLRLSPAKHRAAGSASSIGHERQPRLSDGRPP